MPSDELDVAVGLTFSMAGTGLSNRKIEDYTPPGGEVEEIPASHQGTTGALHSIPADLAEMGLWEFVIHHQQDYDWTADLRKKTTGNGCVITMPSGATVAFDGWYKSYKPQRAPINGKMVADVAVKITSVPVITAAA